MESNTTEKRPHVNNDHKCRVSRVFSVHRFDCKYINMFYPADWFWSKYKLKIFGAVCSCILFEILIIGLCIRIIFQNSFRLHKTTNILQKRDKKLESHLSEIVAQLDKFKWKKNSSALIFTKSFEIYPVFMFVFEWILDLMTTSEPRYVEGQVGHCLFFKK